MTEPSHDDVVNARLEALEVEIATLTRALLSLGSGVLAGGQPGPQGYMAWHENQLNPPAPVEAAPQTDSTQGAQAPAPASSAGAPASAPSPNIPLPPGVPSK